MNLEGAEPRPWRRGLVWLLFLGPFFFASYGLATWVTSLRSDVGVVVFDWERHIPFLPWTIVPYWSIDLLYGVSLLLCATRVQLDNHGKRLIAAQVLAVSCFLLFPLRFSFDRGTVDGPFGWMFATLETFDQPFNQAPSLHIALMVLLWVVYLRAMPPGWRWVVHGVFALIGVSVLTTWQHHFIDVPTGLWLGWFCLWLFPDDVQPPLAHAALTRDPFRLKLTLIYGAVAMLTGALALAVGGLALWLLWGCGALLLVALGYLAVGPAVFQKRADGSMSLAARWLLEPYLFGARLNAWLWTRRLSQADLVAEGVLLGRLPRRGEALPEGLAAIVDVSAELPCPPRDQAYASIPMLDLVPPDADQIARAVQAIETARPSGSVLVCCALGFSRSALVVAAWLLASRQVGAPDEALARVRRARPVVVLRPASREALHAWWTWHQRGLAGS